MNSPMTIKQNGITATLSEVTYHGAQGFVEDNTWQVAEETICAASDKDLIDGLAMIKCNGTTFFVKVTLLKYDKEPADEEQEDLEEEPACEIQIYPSEGSVEKLAASLGLLEHYTKSQIRDVIKRP